MNINVPESARDHFWDELPEGNIGEPAYYEFWAFRFRPPCEVDDELLFRFDGKVVARAFVSSIEPPGQSSCETTGKYKHRWKVFWAPESFEDLRPPSESSEGAGDE